MKFKKEYALLSIVILALVLYLFFNQRDRIHYTLPETPRLDQEDITQITVTQAGETITLKRHDDQWRLIPGDYPADASQAERMLKFMAELEVTALVSEAQSYARYELDAARRIDVKVYQGDQLVRQMAIGKAASTFRHTHVILGDDRNVYHAGGSFRWEFDKSIDDLRDKTVLSFDRGTINRISIQADAQEQVIHKETGTDSASASGTEPAGENQANPAPDVKWATAEGQPVEIAVVDELLEALNPLKCKSFISDHQKKTLANPLYRIHLQGESTHRLEVFSPLSEESSADFPGTSSGSRYAFVLSEFEVEKIKHFYGQLTGAKGGTAVPGPTAQP